LAQFSNKSDPHINVPIIDKNIIAPLTLYLNKYSLSQSEKDQRIENIKNQAAR
jgi:hypothetical protein